jgi:anti-sigma regulatory factor (Ser/Thr protein kinase)
MTTAGIDFMPEPAAACSPAAQQHRTRPGQESSACHGAALPSRPKRRVFPGRPDQIACARRFVSRVLAPCPAAPDAVLLTSELATNALQHTATGAGGDFEVIACHGPGRIRVMITDNGSPEAPALAPRTELATSGQGLMLVAALAARWGHHGDQHRRTVWFEITCP